MRSNALMIAAALAATLVSAESQADEVKLTTLEWPPYSGSLPDNGFSAVIVREAFKAMGHTVSVEVLPWQRAVKSAKDDAGVAGYFPEYPTELDGFTLSASIGDSPLGLITPVGKPVADVSPAGLSRLKLGVVNGYVNAKPIAAALAAGGLTA